MTISIESLLELQILIQKKFDKNDHFELLFIITQAMVAVLSSILIFITSTYPIKEISSSCLNSLTICLIILEKKVLRFQEKRSLLNKFKGTLETIHTQLTNDISIIGLDDWYDMHIKLNEILKYFKMTTRSYQEERGDQYNYPLEDVMKRIQS